MCFSLTQWTDMKKICRLLVVPSNSFCIPSCGCVIHLLFVRWQCISSTLSKCFVLGMKISILLVFLMILHTRLHVQYSRNVHIKFHETVDFFWRHWLFCRTIRFFWLLVFMHAAITFHICMICIRACMPYMMYAHFIHKMRRQCRDTRKTLAHSTQTCEECMADLKE